MKRILITGAGGPAGIAVLRSLRDLQVRRHQLHGGFSPLPLLDDDDATVPTASAAPLPPLVLHAADMSPLAPGLYLVPEQRRALLPPGAAPAFADTLLRLCVERSIDVVVPTVDDELLPLATRRAEFEARGIALALADLNTLELCLDKHRLLERCRGVVATPESQPFSSRGAAAGREFPLLLKPRSGSGSRGLRTLHSPRDLKHAIPNKTLLLQEYLPGEEYSIDVFADGAGRVLAAVPRSRLRVKAGIAVASQTIVDEDLSSSAEKVAQAIGLRGVANVQFRRRQNGEAALLEVNPRFPGTVALTIAAGVDLPELALRLALGLPLPDGPLPYRKLAVLRALDERFLAPEALLRPGPSEQPLAMHPGRPSPNANFSGG